MMKEKTTYEILPGKVSEMKEPTFGMLEEMIELGFDIEDVEVLGANYKKMIRDKDLLAEVVKILFGVETEDVNSISLKALREAFYDFLGECGLRLI